LECSYICYEGLFPMSLGHKRGTTTSRRIGMLCDFHHILCRMIVFVHRNFVDSSSDPIDPPLQLLNLSKFLFSNYLLLFHGINK
jgi:hypothetical protein